MKVLDKFQVYFLKSFLKYLFYVTALVLGIAYMVDVINHLDMAGAGSHVTTLNVMQYRLIRMPVSVAALIPVIVLVVFVVVVIIFQKYSEITAYLTVGGSIASLLLPIAIFALTVAAITILMGEFLSPASRVWAEKYYAKVFSGHERTGNEAYNLFVVDANGDIAVVGYSDAMVVSGFTSISFDNETGRMTSVVRVPQVDDITNQSITTMTGVVYTINEAQGGVGISEGEGVGISEGVNVGEGVGEGEGEGVNVGSISAVASEGIARGILPVSFIESTVVDIPTMRMSELFASIQYDKGRGIDYTQKQYYLYQNLSYSISILGIIILLSPLIIGNPRGHSVLSSGAKGIVIGMLYLLVVNNLMVITKTELITPFTGLILPHIIFAAAGAANLLRRLRVG